MCIFCKMNKQISKMLIRNFSVNKFEAFLPSLINNLGQLISSSKLICFEERKTLSPSGKFYRLFKVRTSRLKNFFNEKKKSYKLIRVHIEYIFSLFYNHSNNFDIKISF